MSFGLPREINVDWGECFGDSPNWPSAYQNSDGIWCADFLHFSRKTGQKSEHICQFLCKCETCGAIERTPTTRIKDADGPH